MLDFSVISNEDDEFLATDKPQALPAITEKPVKKRSARRKKSKKERRENAAYNPRQNSAGRNANFDPSTRGIIQLMGAGTPDAKKAAVRGSQIAFSPDARTQILKTPEYKASTPSRITSQFLVTPQGQTKLIPSRVIQIQGQEVSIYLPENKVKTERLAIPFFAADSLDELEMPNSSLDATIDTPITLDDIRQAAKEKKKARRSGDPVRSPTQEVVMGISARKALEAAGIVVKKRSVHWAHFVSHSIKGNKAQFVNNLGLATKSCNAEMELLNPVLKKILKSNDHPDTLYLSFYPTWVKGYEKIRLLDKLSVEIKDGAGTDYTRRVKFTFDALTLKAICLSEIKIIEKILLDSFQAKTALATETVLLSPKGLLPQSYNAQKQLDYHRHPVLGAFSSPSYFSANTTPLRSTAARKSLDSISPDKENTDDLSAILFSPQPLTPLYAQKRHLPKDRVAPSSPTVLSDRPVPKFGLNKKR